MKIKLILEIQEFDLFVFWETKIVHRFFDS